MSKGLSCALAMMVVAVPSLAMAEDIVNSAPYVVDPAKYPYLVYPSSYEMDNHYEWETPLVPFDPLRNYTDDEKSFVINDETNLTGGDLYLDFETGALELNIDQGTLPEAAGAEPPLPTTEFKSSGGNALTWTSTSPFSKVYVRTEGFGNSTFGAGYSVTASANGTPANSTTAKKVEALQEGKVLATAFTYQREVVRGRAYVCGQQGGCNGGTAALYAMGQEVWSQSLSGSFSVSPFSWSRTFYSVATVVMVGPVPLLLNASISGGLEYSVSGMVGPTTARLVTRPGGWAGVVASASVNIIVASFGVTGSLRLIGVSLPVESEILWPDSTIQWKHQVSLRLSTLSGNVSAWATVQFLFFKKTWNVTIAQWQGMTKSLTLYLDSGTA